jgi:hypothetical protein
MYKLICMAINLSYGKLNIQKESFGIIYTSMMKITGYAKTSV